MQYKTCKSTATVTGCGELKPLSEFQKIQKHLKNYDSVCKKCRNKSRKRPKKVRPVTKDDLDLYNQFDRLMRG